MSEGEDKQAGHNGWKMPGSLDYVQYYLKSGQTKNSFDNFF